MDTCRRLASAAFGTRSAPLASSLRRDVAHGWKRKCLRELGSFSALALINATPCPHMTRSNRASSRTAPYSTIEGAPSCSRHRHDDFMTLARFDHAKVLDNSCSTSRKSVENYTGYPANAVAAWPDSAEIEFGLKLAPPDA